MNGFKFLSFSPQMFLLLLKGIVNNSGVRVSTVSAIGRGTAKPGKNEVFIYSGK